MDIKPAQLIKQIKEINKLANTNVAFKFSDKFNDDLSVTLKHLEAFQDAVKNSQMDVFEAESSYLQNIPRDARSYALGNNTDDPNFLNTYAAQQKKIEVGNMAQTKSWKNTSQLISLYNTGLKEVGITQEDFLDVVASGNSTLGRYLKTTKSGSASLKDYAKYAIASKVALAGMSAVATIANAAISMGLSLALQGAITLIDNWIHKSENLIEAGEEASSKINEIGNSMKSASSLVKDSGEEFAKLAQGVDILTGKNISLNSDDYERFLDLSNQLAETFPNLDRVYDENGNSIVQLDGSVQNITNSLYELLDAQRSVYNQQILAELPDAYDGAIEGAKEYDKQVKEMSRVSVRKNLKVEDLDTGPAIAPNAYVAGQTPTVPQYGSSKLDNKKTQNAIDSFKQKLDDFGIKYTEINGELQIAEENVDEYLEHASEIAEGLNVSGDLVQEGFDIQNFNALQNERNNSIKNSILPGIKAALDTNAIYTEMSAETQSLISSVLNNLDYYELSKSVKSGDQLVDWVISNLVGAFSGANKNEVSNLAEEYFNITSKYESGDLGLGDYYNDLKEFDNNIKSLNLNEDVENAITGMYDLQELFNQRKSLLEKVDKNDNAANIAAENWIDSLTSSEFDIALGIAVDEDTSNWNLEQWKDAVESETIIQAAVEVDIESEKANLETLQDAIQESMSGSGMSKDAMLNVEGLYSTLVDYDPTRLFERTASGIRMNTDELKKLQAEQETLTKTKLLDGLNEAAEKYNKLGKEIQSTSDAAKQSELFKERDEIAAQIEDLEMLSAQYDGVTSAYNKWQQALQGGEEGDSYDSVREHLEEIKELYRQNLTGTEDFQKYVDLISSKNLSAASPSELEEEWENFSKTIDGTSFSILDFLDEGSYGINHFLDAVTDVGENLGQDWITKKDGKEFIDFTDAAYNGLKGDAAVAEALGISVEFLQYILQKVSDYGYDIDLDSSTVGLDNVIAGAEEANKKLIELGKTKLTFDFDTEDIEQLDDSIKQAQDIYNQFTNEDGTLNINLDGATEAEMVLRQLLSRKLQLNAPAVMSIELDENSTDPTERFLKQLQDFQNLVDSKSIMLSMNVNADTTEIDNQINSARAQIEETLKNNSGEISSDITVGFDASSISSVTNSIKNIKSNALAAAGFSPDASIQASVNVQMIDEQARQGITALTNAINNIPGVNTPVYSHVHEITHKSTLYSVGFEKASSSQGDNQAQGTAHTRGTAFANGNWGTKDSGVALGGELGQELVS
ncbi:MAG: hypothetical protein KH231_06280 [Dialister sp.]|uniref:hypothetical protein n=1 Tax=Dialister sp. TaxID=1955814 RepID=UPI001DBBFECB|nr:hypothetical protein [Dialister sp.]MBS6715064.1 hypothetical protein [Dialister sp.]